MKNPALLLFAGLAAILFLKKGGTSSTSSDGVAERQALMNWSNEGPDSAASDLYFRQVVTAMSVREVLDTYNFVFNYAIKGLAVPPGSQLYNAIAVIRDKYNIFS